MNGPFKLRISKNAERLDYDSIPEDVRSILCWGREYDPNKHDIYQFFVIPEFLLSENQLENLQKMPRKMKRKSYDKIDCAFVQGKTDAEEIRFLGIFPVTSEIDGQISLEFEGEALFEFAIPKILKIQLKGRTKNVLQRKKYTVLAYRTDNIAQWIFLRSWISSGKEIGMKIFCSVPKNLEIARRYVCCDAVVAQKGRTIEKLRRQHVYMPQ